MAVAMLIFHQWNPQKNNLMINQEMRIRLNRALMRPDIRISEIGDQIVLVVCRCSKQGTIASKDRSLLLAMVDRLLDPADRVFVLIQGKIRALLQSVLQRGRSTAVLADTKGYHLVAVQEELHCLIERANLLWSFHWRVHGELYVNLLKLSL